MTQPNLPPLSSRFVDVERLPWEKTRDPGVETKTLLVDRNSGLLTLLMKMAPGARLPDHEHVEIEQTYVLEGSLLCGEGECKAGEFVWRPAGSRHEAWAGPQGGLMLAMFQVPNRFYDADVAALEELMTRPTSELEADLERADGDIMVLGVGGKMGPTLARMAKRAAPGKRVIGVARFTEKGLEEKLEGAGIQCIAADLLDRAALERLPRAKNVVFMAGHKFGAAGDPSFTWAMNVAVPFMVAEAFRDSRIVAFSTACVYPFAEVGGEGATEDTPTLPPPGDYAASCVGREQMFRHGSRRYGTPGRLVRLSYAIDMRYGVLYDVAQSVFAGQPVPLGMGYANVIWQGDANEQALRLLAHCASPTRPINISGPKVSVRRLAKEFGRRFSRQPAFVGAEAKTAWLVDTRAARALLGEPRVPLEKMIDWVADWVARGQPSLGKPTHFETRDGKY